MAPRQVAIVGVADMPLQEGRVPQGMSPLEIHARVVREALRDAGIHKSEVDGLLAQATWEPAGQGRWPAAIIAEYLGMQPRFADSTNIGGSSFEALLAHGADAIANKRCEVAVITYASTQRSQPDRNLALAGWAPISTLQYQTVWGLPTPVGAYALAAMRHMYEYGTTNEQLAHIAVAARQWAALNPAATKRSPITIDDVLASPLVADPLHVLDCCLVTDGGGAVVITSEKRARDLRPDPVYLLGHGEIVTHWSVASMADVTRTGAFATGRKALGQAGLKHKDIDVVQLYDSFTITALLTLEGLGFCEPGEGGHFVEEHNLGPGGDFPLNTNGGGLSCLHPGMYGIFLLIEAVRQLRGQCGARQVPDARTALVSGTGGTLSSSATCVLGRD